jgi:ABC-type multidrug transport system permease subunit
LLTYWLCNFHDGADRFWTYLLWLFLDLLAAESLVVLVSALCPLFVLALAVTAFANGLWMAVGGFLVSPRVLNVFWRTWARRIDYQCVARARDVPRRTKLTCCRAGRGCSRA